MSSESLADKVSNLAATYASVTGTEARDVFLKAAAALRSMEQERDELKRRLEISEASVARMQRNWPGGEQINTGPLFQHPFNPDTDT